MTLSLAALVRPPRWADLEEEDIASNHDNEVVVHISLPSGHRIHVIMAINNTVFDLHLWIARSQNLHCHSFCLWTGAEYLTESRLMATLAPECSLLLITRLINDHQPRGMQVRGGMQIFVKTLNGKSMVLEVDLATTAAALKELIRKRSCTKMLPNGIPVEVQRVISASHEIGGRTFVANDRTLHECGVAAGMTLSLLLRLQGGTKTHAEGDQGVAGSSSTASSIAAQVAVAPAPSSTSAESGLLAGTVPAEAVAVVAGNEDEGMSQASSQGPMRQPLNPWMTLGSLRDTGIRPLTEAGIRSQAVTWTRTILGELGFLPIVMTDHGWRSRSAAKICHAIYLSGTCQTQCGVPECSLRLKVTIYLPGHTLYAPGQALLRSCGAHPVLAVGGTPRFNVEGEEKDDAPSSQPS